MMFYENINTIATSVVAFRRRSSTSQSQKYQSV